MFVKFKFYTIDNNLNQRKNFNYVNIITICSLIFYQGGSIMKETDKTQQKRIAVRIRTLNLERDLPGILKIERESFKPPLTKEDFIFLLDSNFRCPYHHYPSGMVAYYEDELVGFIIYNIHKTYINILIIAVGIRWRHNGIGSQIIEGLIAKLNKSKKRLKFIKLNVRESDLAAQLFFRHCGFRAISIIPNFFNDTPEDAYLMVYSPK